MMRAPLTFPPAMSGEPVAEDPFAVAITRALTGCDAGLVTYRLGADRVSAALVLTPEVPLRRAMAMLPLVAVGMQNALGVLAPPELAVHLDWAGGLRVNGAQCGSVRACAATQDPDSVPDWLILGVELPLLPEDAAAPGLTPDRTALMAEGCADLDPGQLIESWARHVLNQIARWESDGPRALHAEWRGLAHGLGEPVQQAGLSGHFLGVDEDFGMLLRDDTGETHLIALSTVLEDTP